VDAAEQRDGVVEEGSLLFAGTRGSWATTVWISGMVGNSSSLTNAAWRVIKSGILDHGLLEEQLAAGFVRRQRPDGVAAQGGVLVSKRGLVRVAVEGAEAFQRPEGVDGPFATGIGTHALLQRRSRIGHVAVHEETLGGEAPELIAAVERRDQVRRLRRVGQRNGWDSSGRPSTRRGRCGRGPGRADHSPFGKHPPRPVVAWMPAD
jgi:hypothetical protein